MSTTGAFTGNHKASIAKWLIVLVLVLSAAIGLAFRGTADVVKSQMSAADFLADNAKKAGVIVTASGLQYEVLRDAAGPKPLATDTVAVHYEGRLPDGTVFDSSYTRREPAIFPLNQVIPGWTEGVQLMSVGSKFRFAVPSELGYGAQGAGGVIPPNAALVFDVELLGIKPRE